MSVTVRTRPPETVASRIIWHRFGVRCWLALQLYRMAELVDHLADKIDPPRRHMR